MIGIKVFADANVEIHCNGCRYLDVAIGSTVFLEQYARKKVDEWIAEVLRLSVFCEITTTGSIFCLCSWFAQQVEFSLPDVA